MSNGTAIIQAIRLTAPANPSGLHSNVNNRGTTTTNDRAARAERTAQMAAALLPAIVEAYGADSIEAQDAQIALEKTEDALLSLIFPVAA